jgi:hypothetical protein
MFFMLVSTLFSIGAEGKTYNISFNEFPANVPAESLGIPGVTFTPNPPSTWFTVNSRDLSFVGLGGTCLYQPNTIGSLEITFQPAVSSASFSFAQNNQSSTTQLRAEAFLGSASVGTVVQTATTPAGAFFGEGFVNLNPQSTFDRLRISSVTQNLIAIDDLRADGVLLALVSQPQGMLQPSGSGGAIDSYTIANRGNVSASVALTQSGAFFTQSPSSFALAPGATQKVTLTGTT